MPSESFIAENVRRRANINKTRAATGMVPPAPPATSTPAKKSAPKVEAIENDAINNDEQQLLKKINVTLNQARLSQERRLLLSGNFQPTGTARMQMEIERFDKLFRPRWT